jgi:hypothetical protein
MSLVLVGFKGTANALKKMFENKQKSDDQKTWRVSQVKVRNINELRKVIELRIGDWFNSEEELKSVLSKKDLFIKEFLISVKNKIKSERQNKSDPIKIIYKKLEPFQAIFFVSLLKACMRSNVLKHDCFFLGLSIVSLLSINHENSCVFLESGNEAKHSEGALKEGIVDENFIVHLNFYLEEILKKTNPSVIEIVSIMHAFSNFCCLQNVKEQLLKTSFFESLKQCLDPLKDIHVLLASTLLLVNSVKTLQLDNEIDQLYLERLLKIEVFKDIQHFILHKNSDLALYSLQALTILSPLWKKEIGEYDIHLTLFDCISQSNDARVFREAKNILINYYWDYKSPVTEPIVCSLISGLNNNFKEYRLAIKEEEGAVKGDVVLVNDSMLKSSIIRSRIVSLTEVALEIRMHKGFEESFVSKNGIVELLKLCKDGGGNFTDAVRFLEDHFKYSTVEYELKDKFEQAFLNMKVALNLKVLQKDLMYSVDKVPIVINY